MMGLRTNSELSERRGCSWLRVILLRPAPLKFVFLMAMILLAVQASLGQTSQPQKSDYSTNPRWFPNILSPYKPQPTPPPDLTNSKSLSEMIRDGKIELSLQRLAAVVIENNLSLAVDRYNNYFAQADLLRTKSGQAARGVDSAGAVIPDALFSTAIGAGVGGGGGQGGSVSGVGGITASPKSQTVSPRGGFDPDINFQFSWDHTTSPLNTLVVAGSPVVTTNTTFFSFGFVQAFTTGTSLSVDVANQRQSSTQQSLIYNPDVITRMSVIGVQQLTNGFGRAFNRRFQTVARNNVEFVKQWYLQQVNTTLAQAENGYWNLVSAQEQVRSTEQALQAAQRLYEDNKRQAEIGTLAPLDVVSAQSQVASTQRDLIVAQTNLQQQELTLKNFFSKQIAGSVGDAQIVATDPLPTPQDSDILPLDQALATAARNRPEVSEAEATLRNNQVAVKVTQNFLKPTFNVFGLFATAGLSGNQFIRVPGEVPVLVRGGVSQELNQFISVKYPEYAIGFALTIPIKNRSAQADNARAGLQERQSEISLQSTENQIGIEVRTASINLMQAKAVVAAAASAVDFSRQTLDAEQKKAAEGLSTPYNIILDQRNLLEAQLAEVQARASYANALVEMELSTGVLLDKSRISAEDAIRGRITQ
jgi:outer membrane protein